MRGYDHFLIKSHVTEIAKLEAYTRVQLLAGLLILNLKSFFFLSTCVLVEFCVLLTYSFLTPKYIISDTHFGSGCSWSSVQLSVTAYSYISSFPNISGFVCLFVYNLSLK